MVKQASAEWSADRQLVERCRSGDAGAFEQVYRQHATRLYNLAFRMVGQSADAEDMLQEIFLLAFRRLDSFRGESSLGTWLYRLGMNLCLDRLRSKAARTESLTEAIDDRPGRTPMGPVRLEVSTSRLDLERAIASLPEGARAAFLLHDVEGFEHREIASILGIAEGTSKSQLHKARLKLREVLTRREPAPRVATEASES